MEINIHLNYMTVKIPQINTTGKQLKTNTHKEIYAFEYHYALEKEMATHSSILAWRIPGTGESGGLPSMGSYRVGHD